MGGICCQSKRKGPILSAPFAAGFTRCPLIFVYFLFVCLFLLTPCANTVKDLENWDNPPALPSSFLHTILAVGGSVGEWIWSDLMSCPAAEHLDDASVEATLGWGAGGWQRATTSFWSFEMTIIFGFLFLFRLEKTQFSWSKNCQLRLGVQNSAKVHSCLGNPWYIYYCYCYYYKYYFVFSFFKNQKWNCIFLMNFDKKKMSKWVKNIYV